MLVSFETFSSKNSNLEALVNMSKLYAACCDIALWAEGEFPGYIENHFTDETYTTDNITQQGLALAAELDQDQWLDLYRLTKEVVKAYTNDDLVEQQLALIEITEACIKQDYDYFRNVVLSIV